MNNLLGLFIDRMARRPYSRSAGYGAEDRTLIAAACELHGVPTVKMGFEIARRRRQLATELCGGVMHEVADRQGSVIGTGQSGAQDARLGVPLCHVCVMDLSLDIFDDVDIGLGDDILLGVRRQKVSDEVLKNMDASSEFFDFRPKLKILVDRHDGVSSVTLSVGHEAHCTAEMQAGKAAE